MKDMLVLGTEMNILTFSIVIVELGMFFFQFIYFLSRPGDENRLWFLILLYLLLQYNIFSGLLPDPDIPISIIWQNILAYLAGFLMSIYFPFYIYKAFDLKQLKFFAYKGAFLFLFLPFIILFIIPYLFTGDVLFSRRIVVVVPLLFSLTFIVYLYRAIRKKYFSDKSLEKEPLYKEKIVAIFLALIFWVSLPVILLFENANNFTEHIFTNSGLLVMTIIYIRSTIYNSKQEYRQLLDFNRELSEKVKERTRQLELINEQQTNTFINLAHETKTPLTLINNYLDIYMDKRGEDKHLKILKTHLNKLTKDIVNFFDLERFKKGFYQYSHDQITSFSDVLKENIRLFEAFALSKEVELKSHVEDNLYVKADPESIDRVINNLIENAIKYSSEGGEVSIRLFSEGEKVFFSVKDNGLGIPKDIQDKIYLPYYQIIHKKKNAQGMGLGLSIVKQIIDEIGGEIRLSSAPEKKPGTEFLLAFDKKQINAAEVPASFHKNAKDLKIVEEREVHDEISGTDKPYLLIVEDNTSMLKFLSDNLKKEFNVYTASSGKAAMDKLITIDHLDLIISDVMMDEMDGFELYESIMNTENLNHIPFIFLTAKTTDSDRIRGLAMGAIDYINKPFMISELIQKINSLLLTLENQRKAIVTNAYRSIMNSVPKKALSFHDVGKRYGLTNREMEISTLIIEGQTQKQIAQQLHISEKTVSTHVQNLYSKLEITNKVELIRKLNPN